MIVCSPGLFQGCFELLGVVERNVMSLIQIQSSFSKFGGLPCQKVLDTAQALNWVKAGTEGAIVMTAKGGELRSTVGYEPMLRKALLDYIEIERPAWLQNATFGRARVLSFLNSEIGQVFVEAGLSHGTSDQVVAFWDDLAARARGQKNESLMVIGREGERLTIEHEKIRTGRSPKWIAVDSNADGYDVLSIVGADNNQLLSIEVKTTMQGMSGFFHVTRNEWEWALEAKAHRFHLWAIDRQGIPSLAIVGTAEMGSHIPSNSGQGSWEVVEIPFFAFQDQFQTSVSR